MKAVGFTNTEILHLVIANSWDETRKSRKCFSYTFIFYNLAEKFMKIFKMQLHSFKPSQSHAVVTYLIFDNKINTIADMIFRMVLNVKCCMDDAY